MSEKVHWVAEASAATLSSKSGAAAVGGGVSSFAALTASITPDHDCMSAMGIL